MRFNQAIKFVFFALAFLLNPSWQTKSYADPILNASVPDFTLKSNSGQNLRLSEQRGNVILVNFWASWCGPCREELPEFEKLRQKYRKYGFEIWAVNIDIDSNEALKFVKPLSLSFPILFDNSLQISQIYKVETMPSTFLIDRDGKLRFVHHGFQANYVEKYDAEIHDLVKE